ncbi:hypothetical protein BT67DRAFT_446816 [Trichocladium antarcticum]|uniref:60S ribosomal protein L20 n=1 Tax=Trichocladium antarcticum TaxID=1450529 RepID=A0AAN6UTN8_9PEZI|nr:hypothetical protein BT67DRAFT_446816 [Trichocladium antarcticum]
MEAIVTRPAVSGCCRAVSASRTASSRLRLNTTPSAARQQSTTSRTKKALIVPPHATFFKLNGSSGPRHTTDQIIFNPPSSAPSPHHLTKADIEELRRLRAADPVANSVQNLARRYRCSKLFILMCCRAPQDHKDKIQAAEDAVKSRWGPRRRQAREERARRMGMLFSGEL